MNLDYWIELNENEELIKKQRTNWSKWNHKKLTI